MMEVTDDWSPTSANINALPEPLCKYIYHLETMADPAGMVRENIMVKQENKMLRELLRERMKAK